MFWTNLTIGVLLTMYVFVCVFMALAILMQRSKQEGLGAAFGQSMASELLGTGVSSFLVKSTVVLAIMFFLLSISLARLYSYRAAAQHIPSPIQQELLKPVAPLTPSSTNAAPVVPTATSMTPAPVAPAPASPVTATNAIAPAAPAHPPAK